MSLAYILKSKILSIFVKAYSKSRRSFDLYCVTCWEVNFIYLSTFLLMYIYIHIVYLFIFLAYLAYLVIHLSIILFIYLSIYLFLQTTDIQSLLFLMYIFFFFFFFTYKSFSGL